jgi:tetratricopeptide (TPR) repeat protein
MKLKTKITLTSLLSIFALFTLAMVINTYYFYNEAKDFRKKEIDSAVSFYVSEIDKLTLTAEKLGTDVATLGEHFYEIKSKGTFDFKAEVSSFLVDKVQNYPEIIGSGIWYEPNLISEKYFGPYATWKNKKAEITWEYSNEKYNYFNQIWYKLALPENWKRETVRAENKYRTPPFIDDLDGVKTVFLSFSTLMYSKSKKIIGVTTVDIGLNKIKELLLTFNITPKSYIILIDQGSDKIIYHPNAEKILENYRTIDFLKDKKILEKVNQDLEISINNEMYILHSTTTKSSFILLTLLNKREAYSVVIQIVIRNIILSLITIILIGIIIHSLVNKSIKPLDQIISILRGVSDGSKSMNDRIDIKTKDEFGELASNYNDMAFTIQKQGLEIKEHSERLEEKVANRTMQLNKTLEEITILKTHQDGDYFLTSLLLDPLNKNKVQEKNIVLEFFIKQKKKFTFKKYSKEIGGDICAAHKITLQQKNYTVFLNADAMGKSIQGAGGALILGSVFNAIVERTLTSDSMQALTPERWIKNSFLELHRTFETFDGSMMVSMVLGLLDNDTGFLYFINAEHPLSVLYRDNKASFLEPKVYYRKLGIMEATYGIYIDTLQLKKDDVIFLGSDGRDDIILDSTKLMNEDENRFLGIVEISEGNINKIISNIERLGDVTDDLSILRLEYKGDDLDQRKLNSIEIELVQKSREAQNSKEYEKAIQFLEEADKLNPNHSEILRDKIKIYLVTQSFLKLIELCDTYTKLNPEDEEVMHIFSLSNKKLKYYTKAYSIAEQLWLRKTEEFEYVFNYMEICNFLKFFDKSKQALKFLIDKYPNHPKLFNFVN